jgi:hypothetical protein
MIDRTIFRVCILGLVALAIAAAHTHAAPAVALAQPSALATESLVGKACPPRSKFDETTPPGCREPPPPAAVCVQLTAQPNATVAPGQIVTFRTTIRINWRRHAHGVAVTIPYDSAAFEVVDAAIDHHEGWVTEVAPDAVSIQLGTVPTQQPITASLRLRIRSAASPGQILDTRARVRWDGGKDGIATQSNRSTLAVASASTSQATVPLAITPVADAAEPTLAVQYAGFAAHEVVSLWYDQPGDSTVSLDTARADAEGNLSLHIPSAKLSGDAHTIVAYGQCSDVSATGSLRATSFT